MPFYGEVPGNYFPHTYIHCELYFPVTVISFPGGPMRRVLPAIAVLASPRVFAATATPRRGVGWEDES